VHRLLIQQRKDGCAYVAATGAVTAVMTLEAAEASATAPAPVKAATAVSMSVALGPLVDVFVEPGASRVLGVFVPHV
jgi:hypothetical protein